MRNVLKNNYEVAHYWANKSQPEGRVKSMLFEGDVIYSYGHHWELGRLMTDKRGDTVAFLQSSDCSPSTRKHEYVVRQAANHLESFYVKDGYDGKDSYGSRRATICVDHLENLKWFIDNVDGNKKLLEKGRRNLEWVMRGIQESVAKLLDYADRFAVPTSKLPAQHKKKFALFKKNPKMPYTKSDLEAIEAFKARESRHNERERQINNQKGPLYEKYLKGVEARERKAAEKARLEALAENERRDAWLRGESVSYPQLWGESHKLRVIGDRIETTGRAEISLKAARRFWDRFKSGASVDGFDFGPYKADEDGAVEDGVLRVGCHRIPVSELSRIAQAVGW